MFKTSDFFKAKEKACVEVMLKVGEINFDKCRKQGILRGFFRTIYESPITHTNKESNIYKVSLNSDKTKLLFFDIFGVERTCDDILYYSFDDIMDFILSLK